MQIPSERPSSIRQTLLLLYVLFPVQNYYPGWRLRESQLPNGMLGFRFLDCMACQLLIRHFFAA